MSHKLVLVHVHVLCHVVQARARRARWRHERAVGRRLVAVRVGSGGGGGGCGGGGGARCGSCCHSSRAGSSTSATPCLVEHILDRLELNCAYDVAENCGARAGEAIRSGGRDGGDDSDEGDDDGGGGGAGGWTTSTPLPPLAAPCPPSVSERVPPPQRENRAPKGARASARIGTEVCMSRLGGPVRLGPRRSHVER